MQNNTDVTQSLDILKRISLKGYIKSENNNIANTYRVANHALADFLKATPISATDAVDCMELLNKIGNNTLVFFSLFSKSMMDLYRWSSTGDELSRNQGKTKLLYFFSKVAPSSVEEKERLLESILKMPDLALRKNEVSRVLSLIATHYDKNNQAKEDPNNSVLVPLKGILNQIKTVHSRIHSGDISHEKERFLTCSEIIKKYRPDLYEEDWDKTFSPSKRKIYVPVVKEAVDICSHNVHTLRARTHKEEWERE